MNAILRLFLLALACFALTALLMLVFNSMIGLVAACYKIDGCVFAPITGTIAYTIDALNYLAYFSIFPLGTVLGRREFRKVIRKQKYRRFGRIAFAAIPIFLLPLKHFFTFSFF